MDKVPVQADRRFRLGDILGSGSYAVVYRAQNIIKNDAVAVKLEPITHSSSVQREYNILKHLEGGVGIPRALWFILDLLGPSPHSLFLSHSRKFSLETVINLGDQLLSRLEYIHMHNYIHGDIKPQNVVLGLGDLRHTAFIIDFGIREGILEYVNQCPHTVSPRSTSHWHSHISRQLTITWELNQVSRDDLESLTYMLIYFLQGSLPWLTSDQEKLSSSSILERKVNTTIEDLCRGIPVEFATMLIYTRSLAFSEDPDYNHLHSLLRILRSTLPAPAIAVHKMIACCIMHPLQLHTRKTRS
ncbi:casein kinase I delta [Suillus subluteus]|nr:casein kinase I delta [Suillus subluteus]